MDRCRNLLVYVGESGRVLYTRDTDGQDTRLLDIRTDEPFAAFVNLPGSPRIRTFIEIDGTYLMFLGFMSPYTGADLCRGYRSTDGGSTWTQVESSRYGMLSGACLGWDVHGAEVVWGDYNVLGPGYAPGRLIRYSADAGTTWETIYTRPDPDSPRSHLHDLCFDSEDPDVLWVAYGDDTG